MKTKISCSMARFALISTALIGINLIVSADTWTQKTNLPAAGRIGAVAFSIGNKGYLGTGDLADESTLLKDFWEWDQATNVWTQKADYGGGAVSEAVGFSIGAKGYIGTGCDSMKLGTTEGTHFHGFWEWDQATNIWSKKADFAGDPRWLAVGFSIGNKGYIGSACAANDFWEYDPATDTWTKKADFAGMARWTAVGFSIGAKGYVGTGNGTVGGSRLDFWEYDQATDTWTQKSDFAGGQRYLAAGFSIGTKGYIGTGVTQNGTIMQDFWEWDQATNVWTRKADYGAGPIRDAIGFSIGDRGYIATGTPNSNKTFPTNYFWEYFDTVCNVSPVISTDDPKTVCMGYPIHLHVSGGTNYLWSTGATTASITDTLTATTTYFVTANSGICSGSDSITITVNPCNTAVAEINSASQQVVISPNPFNEYATINVAGGISKEQIEIKIYDMLGKEVRSINFSGDPIILERGNLSDGVYLYKALFKNQNVVTGKFIISAK